MTDTAASPVGILSALVMTCAAMAFSPQPVTAQTATNLKCKGCVGARDLKKKAVKTNRIRNNAVTGAKIATGAVGASDVASNSIPATDLSNESGAAFDGGNQFLLLTVSATTVRSVTLSAPSSGVVIVNTSGIVGFADILNLNTFDCSITTGTTVDFDAQIGATQGGNDVSSMPFAATRGFTVGPGSTTFRLVCTKGSGDVRIFDSQMTAIFVPTSY